MSRTDIINAVVQEVECGSYLEIGIYDPRRNFALITAKSKVGVDRRDMPAPCDPSEGITVMMTSDAFFAAAPYPGPYSVIFIDGDHREAQSLQDFKNSLKFLDKGGVIILHDCLPKTADAARPVKRPGGRPWNGEVWKTWRYIRSRKDLVSVVVDTDHGVGLVKRGRRKDAIPIADRNTWQNPREWANVITIDEFLEGTPRLRFFPG